MKMNANPAAEGITREGIIKLEGVNFNKKFWAKDPTLWKQEAEHQELIKNFLGWQTVYNWTLEHIDEVLKFAEKGYAICNKMRGGLRAIFPTLMSGEAERRRE